MQIETENIKCNYFVNGITNDIKFPEKQFFPQKYLY